jgi:two-component system, chemotaxis family, sensor kinase Cph1
VYWFRSEQQRIVNWAGNPEKIGAADQSQRLSPRGSFALWQETVRGRSLPWTEDEVKASDSFREAVVQFMIRRAEEIAAAGDNMQLAGVEREKALQSERSARIEAERVSQMKDEFVATLSHELRTPLNAILGWSQVLQMAPGELSDDVKQGLVIIEQNARSQAVMIEDLMEISRIISGKIRLDLQDVDLADVLRSAIETVSPVADAKGVRFVKLIDPLRGARSTADPNRLKQVIWNLLTNAVKFTPKHGTVRIILRKVESHAELTVVDTGIGIAPEVLPHIFDRYRQADSSTSRKYGGLGLGLAIVRTLVELHGGTVSAHSQGDGAGSQFVVTLPFSAIKVTDDLTPSDTIVAPGGGANLLQGLRVLIVDDESDSRQLLGRFLQAHGCHIQEAESGATALQLQDTGVFDVIVSDVGMPQMDGYAFIREWRSIEYQRDRARIPAIALTAYARSEDRRRALTAGFQSHVTKPVEIGELVDVIRSLANR